MPSRKKVTIVPVGLGENKQGPSVEHMSMHTEGTKSFGEASQLENKNIVIAIEDLQCSHAAMWAEF